MATPPSHSLCSPSVRRLELLRAPSSESVRSADRDDVAAPEVDHTDPSLSLSRKREREKRPQHVVQPSVKECRERQQAIHLLVSELVLAVAAVVVVYCFQFHMTRVLE